MKKNILIILVDSEISDQPKAVGISVLVHYIPPMTVILGRGCSCQLILLLQWMSVCVQEYKKGQKSCHNSDLFWNHMW